MKEKRDRESIRIIKHSRKISRIVDRYIRK
jgi:hypothetical protein